MDAFTKICLVGFSPKTFHTYVKIVWNGKKLSLTGVEGPLASGNAKGACGQINMHEWELRDYAPGWNADDVAKLRQIWADWHMNEARAYDAAMARDGWREQALTPMLGYTFRLTDASSKAKKAAEAAALEALRMGQEFKPTAEQITAASRQYDYTAWVREGDAEPAALPGYERAKALYGAKAGGLESPERKTLGWMKPSEHPDGLLTRVHPESGNGYGSRWYHEDVPQDVLEWLAARPDTDKKPAWI